MYIAILCTLYMAYNLFAVFVFFNFKFKTISHTWALLHRQHFGL